MTRHSIRSLRGKASTDGRSSERLCHVNLTWPRKVSTTQFEFMRQSQLATSGSCFSEDAEHAAGCEMAVDVESIWTAA